MCDVGRHRGKNPPLRSTLGRGTLHRFKSEGGTSGRYANEESLRNRRPGIDATPESVRFAAADVTADHDDQ